MDGSEATEPNLNLFYSNMEHFIQKLLKKQNKQDEIQIYICIDSLGFRGIVWVLVK